MARRKEGGAGQKPGASAKEKPFYRPFAGLERQAEKKKAGPEGKASPDGKAPVAQPGAPSRAGVSAARPAVGAKPGAAQHAPAAAAPSGPEPSFAELLYGVRPLAEKEAGAPRVAKALPSVPPGDAARDPSDEAVMAHLRGLIEGSPGERFEVNDDGKSIEGHRPEVDRATLRRLRRGELPVDGRFDLHGLSAGAAREAVEGFVQRSRVRGDRVLLLVHGKGGHSPGGRGVLRGEIAAWLSQGEASRSVSAFATAAAEDGGEGALYVLLRRA